MATSTAVPADIYADLGLERVINGRGNQTMLGGSRLSPRVLAAMESANASFVDLDALLLRVGSLVAETLGCESAYPTSGCAAAMALATAACIAGNDPAKIARIPNTKGMPSQVIIQSVHRNQYDRMPSVAGGELIVVDPPDFEDSLTDDVAAVYYCASFESRAGSMRLSDVIEMAHARDVPVILDAAGQVSPPELMNEVVGTGADLVGFGAKYFGAPNSTGLLCGRGDLVHTASLHGFTGFENHGGKAFGRGYKLDRAEAVAVIEALREWRAGGYEAARNAAHERALAVVEGLADVPGITVNVDVDMCWVVIAFKPGNSNSSETVAKALLAGHPPIWSRVEGGNLALATNTLTDADVETSVPRLREILGA
jgi:L-seryl-tRNA(Ser) seleniumtransferase